MSGALNGLRVLDFSTLLPGPMATLFLAEAGAEVIKIERPGSGDEMRSYVPRWGDDSANFNILNRGKKSIALDLKSDAGRAQLMPLIEGADIIVEQFRPGVMARLGLSYDDVRAIRPGIIYCSISGYGQSGPRALRAGHDLNYQGDAGLLALSYGSPQAPVVPAALIADIAGGAYPALVNILMALRQRDQTGEGAYIDIAMAETIFPFLYSAMAEGQVSGDFPGNGDSMTTGASPRYRLYPTSDGRILAAAPLEQKFWESFCEAIGLEPALRDDTRDPEATGRGVAAIIASRPASEWEPVFDAADCCCSIVRTVDEAMRCEHYRARGLFDHTLTNAGGDHITALPLPIAPAFRAAPDDMLPAPALGAQTGDLTGGDKS
ncbi:CoA transferase [Pseudooceanicola nanhaiensis]|jgi:crotonobetainyl-CoA:carnitine CoA-transferase CaiB-like acyl-CoA transferase|uniref:CoA transferase n=1 Tax=Pseudooceanicola nanhaiensis TaxID=375761 RepID=A0A917TDH2_9RHOB|nr:CoA transferase [Pseudooceanicola nanhaiensis]GGM16597.1 CoA transferase [Pseudooceanicola nanhaiensis]